MQANADGVAADAGTDTATTAVALTVSFDFDGRACVTSFISAFCFLLSAFCFSAFLLFDKVGFLLSNKSDQQS